MKRVSKLLPFALKRRFNGERFKNEMKLFQFESMEVWRDPESVPFRRLTPIHIPSTVYFEIVTRLNARKPPP